MSDIRLAVETIGWAAVAYGAWWLFVLLLECLFVILAAKWRRFLCLGRLAIYFNGAGEIGTITSFETHGGDRYDQLFWLVFWKRN
jgi:hypothetical protein